MCMFYIHTHVYMLHIHTCIHAPYMCLGRRQLTQEERLQGKAVEESSYQREDVGEEEGAAREMAAVI